LTQVILKEDRWEKFDPQWVDRIEVILEDFSKLGSVKAMIVLDNYGKELTETIYPNGKYDQVLEYAKYEPIKQILELGFGEELPLYLTEEKSDSIVLTGFAADMILIVEYGKKAFSGAIGMRFEKRIRHMRNVYRNRTNRATIV